jgi:hypothetical protein
MEHGWRLGPHWYACVAQLAMPEERGAEAGCSWAVVRRDGEGPRWLLQLWEPAPGKRLDALKEEFLQRFSRAEAVDPGACRLGFDPAKAWFLQELAGVPLPRLWNAAGRDGRRELRALVAEALGGARAPRILAPDVIGIEPGRVLAPRILGGAQGSHDALFAALDRAAPAPGAGGRERPWDGPPDLPGGSRTLLRGRSRELTYLKSLVLGLGASAPMERVLVLLGEEGLGHDRLCDWAAAVAETEGFWVADLEIRPEQRGGALLERLLTELVSGLEPDLYAARPAVARALAGRLATFGFLRGGKGAGTGERPAGPGEIAAALEAIAFAQARHPRLMVVRGLERAVQDVPDLVRALVEGSRAPWLVSARDPGPGPAAGACLDALKNRPDAAAVVLGRLEDGHLLEALEDLLGPHDLPPAVLADLCAAGLGNPGLLRRNLELAMAQGALVRDRGRWTRAPEGGPVLEPRQDLAAEVLLGRLRRLHPGASAAVRYLALADEPLPPALLGRALDLDGDGVEEALRPALEAKLALASEGAVRIAGAQARDLVLARMPARDKVRCARDLLRTLDGDGGRTLLTVRLQTFALDREAALAKVLEAVERARCGPGEAERIMEEAGRLEPDPRQEARLWEFLADARSRPAGGDGQDPGIRTPWDQALEALDRAEACLRRAGGGWAVEERAARLLRKRSLLEFGLRRLDRAERAVRSASALLADHPFHPEQPLLRLAQGRLRFARGSRAQAEDAWEDGLALLRQKGAAGDSRDEAALMLELGRAQGEGGRLQAALAALDGVRHLAEHLGDPRLRVEALAALGQVRLESGPGEAALECLRSAATLAAGADDPWLLAECRFALGSFWSGRQCLGPAQASLESAASGFERLGDRDRAAQVRAWQARNLTALGEPVRAELLLVRDAGGGDGGGAATPLELAERAFLEAESAGFLDAWGEARRCYLAAANRFEHAGLVWRSLLARLRCIQAEAQEPAAQDGAGPRPAWIRLERLKGPVEGAGSPWLELEWHRARALLLGAVRADCPGPAEALMAWGEVMAGARRLRFPALVVEAGARSSELLLEVGEGLGARARIQDAVASFQELGWKLPEGSDQGFLGRKDIHGFLRAADRAGLRIPWPPTGDPLPDWTFAPAEPVGAPSLRAEP